MSKIKCIIMEDEPLAAKVLAEYISQVPFLNCREHSGMQYWQRVPP